MKKMTDNELIAEFLGWAVCDCGIGPKQYLDHHRWATYAEHLDFEKSWNKIMPVVEAIKSLSFESDEANRRYKPIINEMGNVNLSNVHFCVVQFIKWHNEHKDA